MAQSLFTTQTPALGDVDNGAPISLGQGITTAVDGTITHVRWFFPTGAQPGGAAVKGAIFDDAGVKIAGDVTFASPGTAGGWNTVALAGGGIHVDAGDTFVTAVRTPARYVASTNATTPESPIPFVNGDLAAPGVSGVFNDGADTGDVLYPTGNFNNGCYFVDVVFVPDGVDPAEGDAALGLDLAVAATGARASQGPAALGLNLAVAAAGARASQAAAALGLNLAVAATGATAVQGAAALTLDMAVAATGARESASSAVLGLVLTVAATGSAPEVLPAQGSAALVLDLALAGAGARASAGAAAFILNLALDVQGPGGTCTTVPPYPWTCDSVESYPATCRPVPSFSEVQ